MLPALCMMVTALTEGLCALVWSSRENGAEVTLQKLLMCHPLRAQGRNSRQGQYSLAVPTFCSESSLVPSNSRETETKNAGTGSVYSTPVSRIL